MMKYRLGKDSMVRFRVMSTNIHEGTMVKNLRERVYNEG